jgi:hypothetical protein
VELAPLIRGLSREPRRPLPTHDPAIDALAPDTRAQLARIWADRARSELGAGSGFAIVVTELYALGADPKVLALATRAAHDEVKHAELCHLLACAYAGAHLSMPRPKRVGMPVHAGADDTLRAHLHVVGLSCINETIAAAFVEACLLHAEAPLVRAIQTEHLADEVEHARVGWAHLASIPPGPPGPPGAPRAPRAAGAPVRAAVAAWVPRLIDANVAHWRDRIAALPAAGVPGHAYPPRPEMLAAVDRAVAELVLPGFAHVGLAVPMR